MKKVFKTIKQVITGTLPDKYIFFLLEDRIDLDDLFDGKEEFTESSYDISRIR